MAFTDESPRELERLRMENARLRALLQAHGIEASEVLTDAAPEGSKDAFLQH